MNLKTILFFTLIIILICGQVILANPIDCNCKKNRTIVLSQPYMKGDDIWELQKQLKLAGFYTGKLTTTYNWSTYLAVKKFQYHMDLPVNGIVRKNMWLDLAQYLNQEITVTHQNLKPPSGEVSLLINGYQRQMVVYSDGEAYHTFPVAVGKSSTKSPVGEWAIIAKDADWGGGFGDRWMRLNVPWGIYGIHGTNKPGSIGTAASHGCIRMFNRHVKILYSWIDVGTRVKIIGPRDSIKIKHVLRPGQTGKDVLLFQEKLRAHGLKPGYTDGRFGTDTKNAMKEFKYIYGLYDDLKGDENTFYILNIK